MPGLSYIYAESIYHEIYARIAVSIDNNISLNNPRFEVLIRNMTFLVLLKADYLTRIDNLKILNHRLMQYGHNFKYYLHRKILMNNLKKTNRVGSGNLFLLLLIILVQLCIVMCAGAQNLKPVKVMYSYETMDYYGKPFTYKLFYIIREQQKEINGKKYNLYTFSKDSNYVNGYIRYDSADYHINFLDVSYKEGQPSDDGIDKEHRLFSFVDDSTKYNYTGRLRGYFNMVSQTKPSTDSVFMKVIRESRTPDVSYIEELILLTVFIRVA